MGGVVRADRHLMDTRGFAQRPGDVGEVIALMLGRDRDGDASVLDSAVGVAVGRHLASCSPWDPWPTLWAANALAEQGDDAGARLLLRTVARVAPDPALDEMAARLRPPGAARQRAAVVTCVVLAAVLLASGAVVALVRGDQAAAGALLTASIGPALVVKDRWARHVRIPGLTLQESRLWRSLEALHPGDVDVLFTMGDGHLRRAITDLSDPGKQRETTDRSGWVGLAGVVGAVLGMVAGLTVPGLPPGAFIVLMPVGGAIAALAAWAALRRRAD
ncbi:hypothetical protein ASG53_16080 [Sanguibacter sp. Leaf3]|nr:hypothetical protein ASG53_16080 [Sanguibacter sp. Leaf3]